MQQLTPFLNVLAQSDRGQYEAGELFTIAFVPILIAVVIFFVGIKLHHAGKPIWLKWIAMVPLAVGLIMGIAPTHAFYGDPVYKDYYGGTWKKGMMHAGGIIMPIIGAIGFVVWNRWLTKQKFEDL